jgi:20S proteasome subunit alpha 6
MRTEALGSRLNADRPVPINRLALKVANKAQASTQVYGGRPIGVGLLIAGSWRL